MPAQGGIHAGPPAANSLGRTGRAQGHSLAFAMLLRNVVHAAVRDGIQQQLAGFAMVGAARTALGYLLYLMLLFIFPYWLAFTIAYIATLVFSMLINGNFIFATRVTARRAVRYGSVYCINYGLSLATLRFLVSTLLLNTAIAPAIVIVVMFPINFLAERYALTG